MSVSRPNRGGLEIKEIFFWRLFIWCWRLEISLYSLQSEVDNFKNKVPTVNGKIFKPMWKETQNSVECYINFLCFDLEKDIRTYFQVLINGR